MNLGLETLVNLRSRERIELLEGLVDDKSKTAYVTEQVMRRDGAILVFLNHSDDVVDTVLREIDPQDSGYVFFASELRLDPVNNRMVPTHRIATPEEIGGLRERRIPLKKLPVLRMLDPIRRWHDFPAGSIVAIERPSKSNQRLDLALNQSLIGLPAALPDSTYFRRVA